MGQEKSKEYAENYNQSMRQKRYESLITEFILEGGFTKKQAIYLINLLQDYVPIV